jgi:hypothetical protein
MDIELVFAKLINNFQIGLKSNEQLAVCRQYYILISRNLENISENIKDDFLYYNKNIIQHIEDNLLFVDDYKIANKNYKENPFQIFKKGKL